jgi:hypothetical protein
MLVVEITCQYLIIPPPPPPHRRQPCVDVVVGLAWSYDPESCAGGSLLLVGSPMPDRSKVMTQTKRNPLALQVGGHNRWELSFEIVPPQGVAPLPMRATGPPGPGGSIC